MSLFYPASSPIICRVNCGLQGQIHIQIAFLVNSYISDTSSCFSVCCVAYIVVRSAWQLHDFCGWPADDFLCKVKGGLWETRGESKSCVIGGGTWYLLFFPTHRLGLSTARKTKAAWYAKRVVKSASNETQSSFRARREKKVASAGRRARQAGICRSKLNGKLQSDYSGF